MKKRMLCTAVASTVLWTFLPGAVSLVLAQEEPAAAGAAPSVVVTNPRQPYCPQHLFGVEGGYVHPYISASVVTSDNIYNSTNATKVSDWKAVYSPGIWFSLPRSKEPHVALVTSNTAPGGRSMFMEKSESFSRYQAYAVYGADIERYQDYDERNTVKQNGEGFLQYNFRGGLSIDLFDKFVDSEDPIGTGDSTILDTFKSNLVGGIATYDLTDKTRLRIDYTNFHLDYDMAASEPKSRDDNTFAAYFFYKYSDKSELFGQYGFTDVDYDSNDNADNSQNSLHIGIKWRPTVKTRLVGKVGMVHRDGATDAGDKDSPVAELTAIHQLTGKTTVQFFGSYKVNESTVSTASFSKDKVASLSLNTQFTAKIGGSLQIAYNGNDFQTNAGAWPRTDNIISCTPSLRYMLTDWLIADLGYTYSKRDSTQDAYDYNENIFFVRVGAGF